MARCRSFSMKVINSFSVAATFALTALSAAPAMAEFEIGLYGGVQTAPHSTVENSVLGDEFVKWKGKSFAMPPYYGIRATWWRNEAWGWGLEVNHAKVYADDPASHGYDRLEFTDGHNIVTANVWRRWQNDTRWTPYVGAGLGVAIPHVDVQPAGEAHTYGYQVTGPAVQLVAGASYQLNERWAVFGEYKGTYSSNKADLDSGGTLKTDIVTSALNIGVSMKF